MTSANGRRDPRGPAAALTLVTALLLGGQSSAVGQASGDFNGDKRDDLAIGVPREDVNGAQDAGAVNVLYGSDGGLKAKGDQFWHQDNTGGLETPEPSDQFGQALAIGDFDGDGYDDLAVGVPNEDVGAIVNAGVVHVLYGSEFGLAVTGAQLWSQNSGSVADSSEEHDSFGFALTTDDFNGDGYGDLAIGAPGETIGVGVVHILFGSMDGLTDTGNQIFSQAVAGMAGNPAAEEFFGWALAAGNFDGDAFDDLAIGVPTEDLQGTIDDAGAVNVIYGSATGLTTTGNQFWHQNTPDIKDNAEAFDRFGLAVTVGDFDNDGFDDLAVGAYLENLPDGEGGTVPGAGAVNVIYGSPGGLSANRNQFWHQNKRGIKEVAESSDLFGSALAAGDFDKDRFDDLAIGVPGEDVGTKEEAGAVNVIYGSARGLKAKGNQVWHQNKKGIGEKAAAADRFGSALTVGRFDKGGHRDLAIGVPEEKVGTAGNAGAVNVIYGSATGLAAQGDQVWHQDKKGVKDSAEAGDGFGKALP